MKIITIIPARGGSKGVPRKNIKELNGKPLIAYTIEEAKKSKYLNEIYVSTDDTEIKEVSERFGAIVIDRPEDLAQDKSPTLPVLKHAVKVLEKDGDKIDLIVLLQATALFKKVEEIDRAIEIMIDSDYDSLMTVSPTPKHFITNWQKEIDNGILINHHDKKPINDDKNAIRRQDLPTTYWKNGHIYIMKRKTLMEEDSLFGNKCHGFIIDRNDIVNIDSFEDFEYAEYLLQKVKN